MEPKLDAPPLPLELSVQPAIGSEREEGKERDSPLPEPEPELASLRALPVHPLSLKEAKPKPIPPPRPQPITTNGRLRDKTARHEQLQRLRLQVMHERVQARILAADNEAFPDVRALENEISELKARNFLLSTALEHSRIQYEELSQTLRVLSERFEQLEKEKSRPPPLKMNSGYSLNFTPRIPDKFIPTAEWEMKKLALQSLELRIETEIRTLQSHLAY